MKNLFVLLFIVLSSPAFSQNKKIEISKVLGGYKYTKNETTLNNKDLLIILQTHPMALEKAKESRALNSWASVLACSGGFLLGWYVGDQLANGERDNIGWGLAATGGGFVALSIPLSFKSNKKMKSAVDLYN